MLPQTKNTPICLLGILGIDNATEAICEPSSGAISLEANAFEQFTVHAVIQNLKAAACHIDVQWYGKDTADGDVSATWTAIGPAGVTTAVAVTGAAAATSQVLSTSIHSRDCTKRYVTAIVTFTFTDQDAGNACTAIMVGETARRDV